MRHAYVAAAVLALAAGLASAEPGKFLPDVSLPAPRTEGGEPLMAALNGNLAWPIGMGGGRGVNGEINPVVTGGARAVGSVSLAGDFADAVLKLRAIGAALRLYQGDYGTNAWPGRLTNLVAQGYLTASNLICAADYSGGTQGGVPDHATPPLSQWPETDEGGSSFFYEFSEAPCNWWQGYIGDGNATLAEVDLDGNGIVSWGEAKQYQLAHGDVVNPGAYDPRVLPCVRCFWFGAGNTNVVGSPTALNLGADLQTVYASPLQWELAADVSPDDPPRLRDVYWAYPSPSEQRIQCQAGKPVEFPLWPVVTDLSNLTYRLTVPVETVQTQIWGSLDQNIFQITPDIYGPSNVYVCVELVREQEFLTNKLYELIVSGTLEPPTRVIRLEGDLAFGGVQLQRTAEKTLTIYNDGNSALNVDSIAYPAGFGGAWTGVVAAGQATNVTVTFAPTLLQGYGGAITVFSDATSGTNAIDCSGTGVASTADIELRSVTAPIWAGGCLPPEPRAQTTTCAMAYTVRNNGAATVIWKNLLYEIYLSEDATFSVTDRKIGQQIIGPLTLAAGKEAVQSNGTVAVNLPADLTAGVYYVVVHAVLQGVSPIDPSDVNNWKATGTIVIPPKVVVAFPVSFPGRTVWALCWDAEGGRFVHDERITSPTTISIYDLKPNRWYWVVLDVETQEHNANWTIAYAGWFMRAEVGPGRWVGNWITHPTISPFWVGSPLVWMLFGRSDAHDVVPYWMDNTAGTWAWGTWTTAIYGGWVGFQVPVSNDWYAVFVADATAGVWY